MSKGTQVTSLRLHPFVRSAILTDVAEYNTRHPKNPLTLTQWIEDACLQRLAHKQRSIKSAARKKQSRQTVEYADPNDCFTPSDIPCVMEVPAE